MAATKRPRIKISTITKTCLHFPPADRNIANPATAITKNVSLSGWLIKIDATIPKIPKNGRRPCLSVPTLSFVLDR